MIIGVSVTKQTAWRGGSEEFANVYHYDTPAGMSSSLLVQEVVRLERTLVFPAQVSFVRADAWGPTDQGKLASEMLHQVELGETGEAAIPAPAVIGPKEMTVLVSWATGRKNVRGNPIFLRKYYHVVLYSGSQGAAMGNEALPASEINFMKDAGNAFKNVLVGPTQQQATLCDAMGRGLPLGTDAQVNPFARIRQFRG